MKKSFILLVSLIVLVLLSLVAFKNMSNSEIKNMDILEYKGKIGERINFKEHPVIKIESVIIKYLGSTPWIQATKDHVALSGTDKFSVTGKNGKNFQIDWSSGTGELPWPSYFITQDGCYELHINVITGDRLENIQDKLIMKYVPTDKCGEQAKDLR